MIAICLYIFVADKVSFASICGGCGNGVLLYMSFLISLLFHFLLLPFLFSARLSSLQLFPLPFLFFESVHFPDLSQAKSAAKPSSRAANAYSKLDDQA